MNHNTQTSQQIDAERMALHNDLQNGHVEPQHYLNNLSGFGQAMTAIGLALGGYGAGINGGSNQAMDFLNKQIDRDVDAQKAEMGKKENMLSHLNQQFGNLQDATTMAKALQMDMYSSKMLDLASKSKDPMALSKAQQLIMAMHGNYEPEMQQMKMRQAALSGAQNGSVSPERLVPMLVPPSHQQKVYEEIGKAQDAASLEKDIMSTYDQAAKEVGTSIRTSPALNKLRALALPMIHDKEGRVNEFEQKTLENIEPGKFDSAARRASNRDAWLKFMRQKQATPIANSFGISIPKPTSGFNRR